LPQRSKHGHDCSYDTRLHRCCWRNEEFDVGGSEPAFVNNGDTAATASVRFFYEEDTRILRYDADGIDSGSQSVIIATLQEGATFSISDIVLV
jgi:hypothetical protein